MTGKPRDGVQFDKLDPDEIAKLKSMIGLGALDSWLT